MLCTPSRIVCESMSSTAQGGTSTSKYCTGTVSQLESAQSNTVAWEQIYSFQNKVLSHLPASTNPAYDTTDIEYNKPVQVPAHSCGPFISRPSLIIHHGRRKGAADLCSYSVFETNGLLHHRISVCPRARRASRRRSSTHSPARVSSTKEYWTWSTRSFSTFDDRLV